MKKTKNIGLTVTTAADGTTPFKEWREALAGEGSQSNMSIIDGKLGDAIYTSDEAVGGEIDADYITRNEASEVIKSTLQHSGTYSELKALKDSSMLVAGATYLLTGYKTKYRQPDTNIIKETSINDAGERLVLTAVAGNQFDLRCASLDFPEDIVTFDFDNVLCEDEKTLRSGFILHRHDTKNRINYPGDWRTMLWARYRPSNTQYILGNIGYNYEVWSVGETVDKNSGKIYKCGNEILLIAHASGVPSSEADPNFFTVIYFGTTSVANAAPLFTDAVVWRKSKSAYETRLLRDTSIVIDCPTFDLDFDIHEIFCEDENPLHNNVWGRATYLKIGARCINNTFYSTGRVTLDNSTFGSDCCANTLLSHTFLGNHTLQLDSNCSGNYFCGTTNGLTAERNCMGCNFIGAIRDTTFGTHFQRNTLLGEFRNTSFGDRVQENQFDKMRNCQIDNDVTGLSTNGILYGMHIESNVRNKVLDGITQLYNKTFPQTITPGSKYVFVRWYDENNVEQVQIIP